MSRIGIALIAALSLASMSASSSQDSAAKPCEGVAFRQFDFWLGEWEVHDAAGKFAGRNAITAEQGGCVIIERWTSANGGTGISMNHYDPHARVWRQRWVSPGVILDMSGTFADGAMTLEGPLQYLAQGRVTLLRGVWTALPDGRTRQHFTESADEGATWAEWFDGYYSRKRKRSDQ